MEAEAVARALEAAHADAYGWALACCDRHRETAEDVLHESYLRILDGRARYRGESAFRTWLFGVVHRVASEARRRARVRELLLLRGWSPPVAEEPASPARSAEAAALIAGLRALPRRQREVLHLVFQADFSLADAASALGLGLGTVRLHYARGKAALRRRLGVGEESA